MKEEKRKIYKRAFQIFVAVFSIIIFLKFLNYSHHSNKSFSTYNKTDSINFYELLTEEADSLNRDSPMWIDSTTEFLNATTLPNKTFQYSYALKIDTIKYNTHLLKEIMEKNILNNFIKTPSCKVFRDNNVTVIYTYIDMEKNFLFKIIFTPNKYK